MVYSIAEAYRKHSYLLKNGFLNETERNYFCSFEEYLLNTDTDKVISEAVVIKALKNLSFYLCRYYGQKVLIFLDEYDTPLQEAYVHGFWDKIADFIRAMFNATFKTNPYLERSLMTGTARPVLSGVTRVSKESIFSDLNNLEIVTVTSEKYETAFGFTQEEVMESLSAFGLTETMAQVRAWYDGFRFGSIGEIYNPWSITKYLDSGKFDSYWVNTSSNSLVSKLIQKGTGTIKIAVEDLLAGKSIETSATEELVFQQLDQNEDAIWSLLLASGYLKIIEKRFEEQSNLFLYRLNLTNREVQIMFSGMIRGWFAQPSARYHDFIKALLANDLHYMNSYMIFEFKVHDPDREKNLEDTVQAALTQIADKNYDAVIRAHGVPPERIWHYGFAFQGKQVLIGSDKRTDSD